MARSVALVTDSTSLDEEQAGAIGAVVIPLQVVIGATSYDEGTEATPEKVAAALKEWSPISTSRPSPEAFLRVYRQAARDGADEVLSIHLSGEVSGTFESAQLAAKEAPLPVETVDSRQLGMATGFGVQAAAEALSEGASAAEAAEVARERAAAATVLFYVDTLEYLRRGGRVRATAALVGSALAVKPLLTVDGGRIVPLEKVRTESRALSRLEELAVKAAGELQVDLAVSHLANAERAATLADHLRERVPGLEQLVVNEVGAVIGAHVGPGMLAVVVSPLQ